MSGICEVVLIFTKDTVSILVGQEKTVLIFLTFFWAYVILYDI